jgi:hypothetical protein
MAEGPVRESLAEHLRHGDSYVFLFVLLIATYLVVSAVGALPAGIIVTAVLFSTTLLLGLHTSRVSRRGIRLGTAAAVLGVVASVIAFLTPAHLLDGMMNLVYVVLLLASIPAIIVRLVRRGVVDFETVAATLSVYVLIGMTFAASFYAAALLSGHPLLVATSEQRSLTQADYFYFSFVTMTTLGYGDIIAATPFCRAVAAMEALLGQTFLATLLAIIVSRLSANPKHIGDGPLG